MSSVRVSNMEIACDVCMTEGNSDVGHYPTKETCLRCLHCELGNNVDSLNIINKENRIILEKIFILAKREL